MKRGKVSYRGFTILGMTLAAILAISLACGAEDTATPATVPTTAPIPTVVFPTIPAPAPTAAPIPTADAMMQLPAFFTGKPVSGGILRIAASVNLQTLAPGFANTYGARPHMHAMCDALLRTHPDFSIHPLLAESWEVSPDGKAVTFNLRKGVKFHDGTDFNAEAVRWNIMRNLDFKNAPLLDPLLDGVTPYLYMGDFVERVEVVDEHTVTFHTFKPYRPLVPFMADVQGFVQLSPTAAANLGDKFGQQPVCAGPFKFVEWTQDLRILADRNIDYWDEDKPYLDGLHWQHVSDSSVRVSMLRTGEADILGGQGSNIRPADLPLVENNPNIRVLEFKSATVDFLSLRVGETPWDNRALRQAVAYGLDRQKVIDVLFAGRGRPAYSTEGDSLWWSDASVKPYPYDPQKAKEKLTEAGFPTGLTLEMGCSSSATGVQICEFLQAMYEPTGIDFEIVTHQNLYLAALQGKSKFRYSSGWAPRADPDVRIRTLFHTKGGNQVISLYSNSEVDKLLDDAAGTFDRADAKKLYAEAIRITAEDAALIPTILRTQYIAFSKSVQNVHWYPNIYMRYRDMWLQK